MSSSDPSTGPPGEPRAAAELVVARDVDAAHGIGGVVWKLPHAGDLDGNLVRLAAGRSIEAHVNTEVDVLFVVRSGGGELTVDGERHLLDATTVALVPRGTSRSITAGPDGIAYLSIHRHRGGLRMGRSTP
jgi:quercetin dioxygenase-like cupin family protein